jgi:hypothetical protein
MRKIVNLYPQMQGIAPRKNQGSEWFETISVFVERLGHLFPYIQFHRDSFLVPVNRCSVPTWGGIT